MYKYTYSCILHNITYYDVGVTDCVLRLSAVSKTVLLPRRINDKEEDVWTL